MSQGFPITPYGDLKEGDEYIRIGGRPVLIREISGCRDGSTFFPDDLPRRSGYSILRMMRNDHGILYEAPLAIINLN